MNNPAAARLPASFPSLSVFRAQDSSRHLTKCLSSVYHPFDWRSPVRSPPIRKRLPIDALAHLTRPLQEGLTRCPLILHPPHRPGSNIPPAQLMARTYHALRTRTRYMLIKDWATDAPTPTYYKHPPCLSAHPFRGLGKLVAGRIHQMRAAKSYIMAHPYWFEEYPSLTCPRCSLNQERFKHNTLHCPARSQAQNLLLKKVDSIDADSTIWTEPMLLKALGQYIMSTKTSFPREIPTEFLPQASPDHSPSPPESTTSSV